MDFGPLRAFTLRLHPTGSPSTELLGTGFLAPIWDPRNLDSRFVLTAGHVVAEFIGSGVGVSASRLSPVGMITVKCTPVAVDRRHDLAILRLVNAGPWSPMPCSDRPPSGGSVGLLGHPDGFSTFHGSAVGDFRGLQLDTETKLPLFEVVSTEIGLSILPGTPTSPAIRPRDLWKGMSGGPVVVEAERPYAIGVIRGVSSHGAGGRVYCVPMADVLKLCVAHGLCLDLMTPMSATAPPEAVLRAFLGELADPIREQLAWDGLSNLFFARHNVEAHLRAIVAGGQSRGRREDLPFVHYFLGRFLLKKGQERQASRSFQEAVTSATKWSGSDSRLRLTSLVSARTLAAQTDRGPWPVRFRKLHDARGTLEGLTHVPDAYIGAELASLIGWECQGLFSVAPHLPPPAIEELQRLVTVHAEMMRHDVRTLPKQAVVNTAMRILTVLWGFAPAPDSASSLRDLAALGRSQALQRQNAIFYIQMALVEAAAAFVDGDHRGLALLLLVGNLMRAHRLTTQHEGISQLMVFLSVRAPQLAPLLDLWITEADPLTPADRVAMLQTSGIEVSVAARALADSGRWTFEINKHKAVYEADFAATIRN